ncbi:MAG: GTP pyrophosphokinase [Nocardioidaceae bacterium]
MAAISSTIQAIVDETSAQRAKRWRLALKELNRLLQQAVDDCHLDDHGRIHVQPGRVKTRGRLADKVQRRVTEEGIDPPRTTDDVELIIDDIVGTRIVCKTLRDIEIVDEAIRSHCGRKLKMAREPDDYLHHPKESGYRSLHHKLSVPVNDGGSWSRIVCEVQVRTRMQDAWGELTHENSYKTGGVALPNLHVALGRHLANMLHEVDELANTLAVATDELLADMEQAQERAPAVPGKSRSGSDFLAPGDTYLGWVVSSGRNYALVVVDEFRGLLGAWAIREALDLDGFVAASKYLQPGDSLKVVVQEHTDERLILLPADRRELVDPA